ncbi:VOC family protein [Saccharophagus degradans]|uniref:VOC family protein n=1 Tax=Saccharophagus degradans TaxID=86304 RepID=A0AAW7XBL8_9GAMM|nr:VOC family protein [Saccharophagus degradans]MBU2987057.1 VOC family protein [Saccharophagus degradans]MDO6423754.1 VOC family protein [Saccharophagus degradans]MDO6607834.1 VOC family protein [Saccharophagus degradans]
MIGYITLGSNNVVKAAEFYEALFEILGAKRVYDYDGYVAWSTDGESAIFSITTPFNGELATSGNGTMIALSVTSEEQVNLLHAKAISLGALNEGDPGMRSGGYYCAYFRDVDGNKLNFHVKPKLI